MQQGGQEGPVGRGEPDLATLAVQLPFEDRDLVAQGEDLRVLGPVAHRQQPQHRQRVGHGEVGQSKQHSKASSPIGRHRCDQPRPDPTRRKIESYAQVRCDQGGRHYRHPHGCKSLVGQRLKLSGMRWNIPGAAGILTLRCHREGNRWDQIWQQPNNQISPPTDRRLEPVPATTAA